MELMEHEVIVDNRQFKISKLKSNTGDLMWKFEWDLDKEDNKSMEFESYKHLTEYIYTLMVRPKFVVGDNVKYFDSIEYEVHTIKEIAWMSDDFKYYCWLDNWCCIAEDALEEFKKKI